MHNPRCPLKLDRLDEALRQRGEDVSPKSREGFIIAFGEALIEGTIDQFSDPERHRPGRVELPIDVRDYESPSGKARRLLAEENQPRTHPREVEIRLWRNRELNGYFGGLLCSVPVARWQELRRVVPELGWQIDEEERWELRELRQPETLSLKPIFDVQHVQRTPRSFLAETLIRTAVISALAHPGICGSHASRVILTLRAYPTFWRKNTGKGKNALKTFQSERSRICKAFPSGHEDPQYRQSVKYT